MDSGAAAPVITVRAGSAYLVSRLHMRPLWEMEITGSATGASRRLARNVRRSSRRLTRTSRHPGVIGRAFPGSAECRIVAIQCRTPREQAKPQQHRPKS